MKKPRHEIPEDIFTEILLRIPAPAISRFRAVSKFHRDLIDGPNFIRQHYHLALKRTQQWPSYVLFRDRSEASSEDDACYWMKFESAYIAKLDRGSYADHPFLSGVSESEYHLIGSCMGIICYLEPGFLFFSNPTTRRCRKVALQDTFWEHWRFFLGYDSVADDLKVLKMPYREDHEYSVYSSRTDSWKQSRGFKDQWPNLSINDLKVCHVEGTNCMYMPGFNSGQFRIVTFDFSTESFSLMPLPSFWNPEVIVNSEALLVHVPFLPASLCGCLCLYSDKRVRLGAPFEVWMMKEYGVEESWAKIVSFDQNRPYDSYAVNPVGVMNNGRQLLLWSDDILENGFYIYDDDKKTRKKVICKGLPQFQTLAKHLFTPSIRLP